MPTTTTIDKVYHKIVVPYSSLQVERPTHLYVRPLRTHSQDPGRLYDPLLSRPRLTPVLGHPHPTRGPLPDSAQASSWTTSWGRGPTHQRTGRRRRVLHSEGPRSLSQRTPAVDTERCRLESPQTPRTDGKRGPGTVHTTPVTTPSTLSPHPGPTRESTDPVHRREQGSRDEPHYPRVTASRRWVSPQVPSYHTGGPTSTRDVTSCTHQGASLTSHRRGPTLVHRSRDSRDLSGAHNRPTSSASYEGPRLTRDRQLRSPSLCLSSRRRGPVLGFVRLEDEGVSCGRPEAVAPTAVVVLALVEAGQGGALPVVPTVPGPPVPCTVRTLHLVGSTMTPVHSHSASPAPPTHSVLALTPPCRLLPRKVCTRPRRVQKRLQYQHQTPNDRPTTTHLRIRRLYAHP